VKNAPVRLLDKTAFALEALDRMADQRTTIVLAHRLAIAQ
jgi:ABC-type transport system involved in Fe-S cluster assembly fused permease/ATPase subunit